VTLFDRASRKVVWSQAITANGFGGPTAVSGDPDQTHYWLANSDLERRDLATGGVADTTLPLTDVRDLVVVPSQNRLYATGSQHIYAVDLVTRTVVATIATATGDQGEAIAASPDGSEVVALMFDGTTSRLAVVDTASNTLTQELATDGFAADVIHLGGKLLTWDDNADELRAYLKSGGVWAEDVAERAMTGPDGAASSDAFHNMRLDPVDGHVYVFKAATAQVLRFDPANPPAYTTISLASPYTCMLIDPDGLGLLGAVDPFDTAGFEHLALPAGPEAPSGYDTTGVATGNPVVDIEEVPY
jgi:DNA-binding beta-propeller fold protein YncE